MVDVIVGADAKAAARRLVEAVRGRALKLREAVVPEALASGVQQLAYCPSDRRGKLRFLLASASLASPVVAVSGHRESGSESRWTLGYGLAAGAAAIALGLIIQYAKRPR